MQPYIHVCYAWMHNFRWFIWRQNCKLVHSSFTYSYKKSIVIHRRIYNFLQIQIKTIGLRKIFSKLKNCYKFIENNYIHKMLNHMFRKPKTHPELASIEKELNSFYDYCKSSGFTEAEMQEICKPLNHLLKTTAFYRFLRKIIILAVIITLIYLLLQSETVAWNLSAVGRIILIKLLPIWNWELLRNEKCLISNFVDSNVSPVQFHCTSCENIDSIPVVNDVDPYKLSEIYLDINVPVIISDGLRNWPHFNNHNFNLTDVILSDKILSNTLPCELSTNMFFTSEYIDTIIKKSGIFPKWYFHFQNCDFTAVKQFRLISPRPYFLRPEILPVQYSWLLMSKNYQVYKYKKIDLKEKITVFGQMFGSNFVKLTPRLNCVDECPVLEVELQSDEAIVFTSLWDLEYKPGFYENNVAIILETH